VLAVATAGGEMADLFDCVLAAVQVAILKWPSGCTWPTKHCKSPIFPGLRYGARQRQLRGYNRMCTMQASPEACATLPAMRLTSRRWRDIIDENVRLRKSAFYVYDLTIHRPTYRTQL
jgi:hypothetical protein